MAAILNSAIMDSAILHKKNFTHSFWLKWMIAAMLKSAILDSAILHKTNFTHSFWLNLMMAAIFEICHLGFRHLVIFSQINSKTLFLHSDPESN